MQNCERATSALRDHKCRLTYTCLQASVCSQSWLVIGCGGLSGGFRCRAALGESCRIATVDPHAAVKPSLEDYGQFADPPRAVISMGVRPSGVAVSRRLFTNLAMASMPSSTAARSPSCKGIS